MLFGVAGCAALDEGYTTHYGLTSTEYSHPAEKTYTGGTVGIQEIEEYEEKYREKDVLEHRAAPESTEE